MELPQRELNITAKESWLDRAMRREVSLLGGITALALLIRVVYVVFLYKEAWMSDAVEYEIIGRNLCRGHGFCYIEGIPTAFRPPLMPFFLSAIYWIFGIDNRLAVYIVQSMIGAATVGITYGIAKTATGDKKTAILSAGIAAIYGTFIKLTGPSYSETIFVFLLCASFYFALRLKKDERYSHALLSGMFLGLAVLARSIGLPLTVAWALWFLYPRPTVRRVALAGVFVCAAALMVVPWTIRNYMVFHEFCPISANGGYGLWQNNNSLPPDGSVLTMPEVHENLGAKLKDMFAQIEKGADPHVVMLPHLSVGPRAYFYALGEKGEPLLKEFEGLNEIEADKLLYAKAREAILANPARFVKKSAKNFVRFWEPFGLQDFFSGKRAYAMSYGLAAFMAVAGIVLSFRRWREFGLFYITLFVFNAFTAIHLIEPRYKMPVEPLLIIFASYCCVTLAANKKTRGYLYGLLGVDVFVNIALSSFGMQWAETLRAFVHKL